MGNWLSGFYRPQARDPAGAGPGAGAGAGASNTGAYRSPAINEAFLNGIRQVAQNPRSQSPLFNLLALFLDGRIDVQSVPGVLQSGMPLLVGGHNVRDLIINTQGNSYFVRALTRVLIEVHAAPGNSLRERVLRAKCSIIRSPSEIINRAFGVGAIRTDIESGTKTQAARVREVSTNAANGRFTRPDYGSSAGGSSPYSLYGSYATMNDNPVCCICGQPFTLNDRQEIEHVISVILLGKLGLIPSTKSWTGLRSVYTNQRQGASDNWLENVINMFPPEKRERLRGIMGNMTLMAHSRCNNLKSQKSPFFCDSEGNFTGNINQPFSGMDDNSSYNRAVIEKSRRDKNSKSKKQRFTNDVWSPIQADIFNDLAGMMNDVDQLNQNASWQLFMNMWDACKGNDKATNYFKYFFMDLIGYGREQAERIINMSDDEFENEFKSYEFEIKTILTMSIGETLLLVQADIHALSTQMSDQSRADSLFVLSSADDAKADTDELNAGMGYENEYVKESSEESVAVPGYSNGLVGTKRRGTGTNQTNNGTAKSSNPVEYTGQVQSASLEPFMDSEFNGRTNSGYTHESKTDSQQRAERRDMRNEPQRQETANQIAAAVLAVHTDQGAMRQATANRIREIARTTALRVLRTYLNYDRAYADVYADAYAEATEVVRLSLANPDDYENELGGGSRESRIRKHKPRKTRRGTKRRRGNKRTQKRGRMQGRRFTRKKKRRTTQKRR